MIKRARLCTTPEAVWTLCCGVCGCVDPLEHRGNQYSYTHSRKHTLRTDPDQTGEDLIHRCEYCPETLSNRGVITPPGGAVLVILQLSELLHVVKTS